MTGSVQSDRLRLLPPPPRRSFALAMADGAAIEVHVHGASDGPRLVMSHGNGFATDAYYPFWRLLADRYEIVLFDFRNYGRNPFHGEAGHDWTTFVDDMDRVIAGIAQELGDRDAVGVFHSLAANTSLCHAIERGWRWSALALFEPPLLPPQGHPLVREARAFEEKLAVWAAQRTAHFSDPEELAEIWRRTRGTSRWVAGAHSLMARSVLRRERSADGWTLSCPGALEARIYRGNIDLGFWPRLAALRGKRILIAGSDPAAPDTQPPGRTAAAMAAEFGFEHAAVPMTTHLLQIERPELCAAAVEGFLRRHGVAARRSPNET